MTGVILVGILAALFTWMWGAQFLHFFFGPSRTIWFIVLAAVLAGVLWTLAYSKESNVSTALASILSVGVIGAVIWSFFGYAYTFNKQYVSTVEYTDGAVESFEDRAPFDVANAIAYDSMQNTTGDATTVRYVADQDTWTMPVIRRGFAPGYESIQQTVIPLFGTAQSKDTTFCEFDPNNTLQMRGGLPHNDLPRSILWNVPLNVSLDQEYGYCNNENEPIIVVPLIATEGLFPAKQVAYGVAVYNGVSGDLDILTDAEDVAEIKGSTYPTTLERVQVSSLTASGSYWDFLFKRSGYEDVTKDGANPTPNPTGIQLIDSATNEPVRVTPLTPRGSSTNIVAMSSQSATYNGDKLNTITVNRWENGKTRNANSSVADNIKSQHSSLSDWANGMEVFEIVPGQDGNWVATIGKERSIVYRATITQEGVITLYKPDGSTVGTVDTETDEVVEYAPDSLMSDLTTDELKALADRVIEELALRADEG